MKNRWSQALMLATALAMFTYICFTPRPRAYSNLRYQSNIIENISSDGGMGVHGDLQSVDTRLQTVDKDIANAVEADSADATGLARRPNHYPHKVPTVPEPARDGNALQDHLKDEQSKVWFDEGAKKSDMSQEMLDAYVDSIFDLRSTRFERMDCPGQFDIGHRYDWLKVSSSAGSKIKYFITLDLTEVVSLLPRLMGTIMRTIQFLGTQHCGLSIVEGRSDDGTYTVLAALREKLEAAGVKYWLQQSDINPKGEGVERIGALAVLRNMAMAPLLDESDLFDENVITVFSNDVAICPDDVLEMLFQHVYQNATMTCGMDWVYGGDTFYDSWISRSMSGNTFFEIPQDVSWAFNKNMFWDDPLTKPKYENFQPFQVYACWGGIAVLDSRPFMDRSVTWRNSTDGECYMGEPTLLSKDLYKLGMGRVMTLPTVNVAYSDSDGSRCKRRRGYVSNHVNTQKAHVPGKDDPQTNRIEWLPPPGQVKCQPQWNVNYWVPPV